MQTRYLITLLITVGTPSLLSAQNVGIGTVSPTRAKLELNGMVGNTTGIFGAEGNGMGLTANWPGVEFNSYVNSGVRKYIGTGYALVKALDPNTGYFYFIHVSSGVKDATAGSSLNAMTIAPNGRVRIGQNAGFDAQLDVARDAGRNVTAYFSAPQFTAFNYGAAEHTYIRGGAASGKIFLNYYPINSKIVIGGGGSFLGVNWGDPVYPLEIHAPDFGVGLMRMGSDNHWLFVINFNYLKFFFRNSTASTAFSQLGIFDYSNGQYSATSDRRLKKQIAPLPPTLEKLMQLQPYRYQMKYNNPNRDETFGLLAQDVIKVFPGLVHVTNQQNTGYPGISDVHTLAYSGLAPYIIKALQEQDSQLDQLEKRMSQLEQR